MSRVDVHVPVEEKDQAKVLGAQWKSICRGKLLDIRMRTRRMLRTIAAPILKRVSRIMWTCGCASAPSG